MTIRDLKGEVCDRIPVRNVIASVFDKTGLDYFVNGLKDIVSEVRFMSTGGTYKKLREVCPLFFPSTEEPRY